MMKLLFKIDKKDYDPNGTTFVRPSVRGIIRKNNKIIMVRSGAYGYYKFPGGGIDKGETHIDTLIREVREEVGMIVIPQTIKEFGYVQRIQKGDIEEIFIQDNFYYQCEVEDVLVPQQLDEYEDEENFEMVEISIVEAIEENQKALATTLVNHALYTAMIEREVGVLQLLLD